MIFSSIKQKIRPAVEPQNSAYRWSDASEFGFDDGRRGWARFPEFSSAFFRGLKEINSSLTEGTRVCRADRKQRMHAITFPLTIWRSKDDINSSTIQPALVGRRSQNNRELAFRFDYCWVNRGYCEDKYPPLYVHEKRRNGLDWYCDFWTLSCLTK